MEGELYTQMSVQGMYQAHSTRCATYPNLTRRIPFQCLLCHFDVLVNFEQVFALFFVTFADVEYSLFIVNVIYATLWPIFAEHQISVIFMGAIPKQFATVSMTSTSGVRQWYLSISCYGTVSFNFNYFIAVSIGKTCSKSLMRFNRSIFTYCVILLLTLSKFSQCFKYSFNIHHFNRFLANIVNKEYTFFCTLKIVRNISRNRFQTFYFHSPFKMLFLVILFSILEIAFSSSMFALKSRHGRVQYPR